MFDFLKKICYYSVSPLEPNKEIPMSTRVEMPDAVYEGLELRIRTLVKRINKLGLFTIESCEGHTEEDKSSFPYVVLGVEFRMTFVLSKILRIISIFNEDPETDSWIIVPCDWEDQKRGYALVLRPQNNNDNRSLVVLRKMQREVEKLGLLIKEFLRPREN